MITAHSSFNTANANLVKGKILLSLEIDGYDRIFTNTTTGILGHVPWIVEMSDIVFDADPLDGTSSINDVTVLVRDHDRLLTADMPGFTFEGKVCRIKTWFEGMSYANAVTIFTGTVSSVPIEENGLAYEFVLNDSRLDLKQVIYTVGDDGNPIDSDHPRTLNAHPLDLLISIWFDELGKDLSGINVTKIERYRDEVYGGVQFEFLLDQAPEAKDFIEAQIFKALGGYLRVNNLGVLTPEFFTPLAGTITPVTTLNRSNMVGIPRWDQADLINIVSFRFDKTGSEYRAESLILNEDSITKYGRQGQHIIEADGVKSGFQGFFLGDQVADAIFGRQGDKNPTLSVPIHWNPGALLEQGDFIGFTHDLVPNRAAGTLGVADWLFRIEGVRLSPMRGEVEVTLVDASYLTGVGAFKIAPDAVPDWTLATTPQKDTYMFITDAAGVYSDAEPGNPLG